MPLPQSGPISLANIQTEFGGANPIALSEYYKGGSYVSSYVTASIPQSGTISLSQFYGASAVTRPLVSTCVISSQDAPKSFILALQVNLQTTNNTGITQTYSCAIYFNYALYTTVTVNVPHGSQTGSYTSSPITKEANYGQVSQYPAYFTCEGTNSNTTYVYIQYDSSPPPISSIQLTGSWAGTGPRTITINYNVYLTRLNLTGAAVTVPLTIINTDTPDLIANSSINVSIPDSSLSGQAPTSFSSINTGTQHYVTVQAQNASGTITSTNSAYFQITY